MTDRYSDDQRSGWSGRTNFAAAMDQHERARQAAEDTTIGWLPVVGGGLLAGAGLGKGGGSGLMLALAGGGLVYWGLSRGVAALPSAGTRSAAPDGERSVRVEKVVTINRPVDEVYAAWRDVESLPRIMSHLESMTPAPTTVWLCAGGPAESLTWSMVKRVG